MVETSKMKRARIATHKNTAKKQEKRARMYQMILSNKSTQQFRKGYLVTVSLNWISIFYTTFKFNFYFRGGFIFVDWCNNEIHES